jgi:hypothetical protein
MMGEEVEGLEGVGGEVSGLIRVWKCVEKPKHPRSKNEGGARGDERQCAARFKMELRYMTGDLAG